MATWDDVRRIASALPETEEGTSWRQPSFRVAGRWFVGMSAQEERAFMLDARPDVFWLTPHYEPTGRYVLVRLGRVDTDELSERIVDSWLIAAPKRARAQLQSDA